MTFEGLDRDDPDSVTIVLGQIDNAIQYGEDLEPQMKVYCQALAVLRLAFRTCIRESTLLAPFTARLAGTLPRADTRRQFDLPHTRKHVGSTLGPLTHRLAGLVSILIAAGFLSPRSLQYPEEQDPEDE